MKAVDILRSGGVVGIPTETVYGLAGSIESKDGLEAIFKTKERPFFDPLIVHVSTPAQAESYTDEWNEICECLTQNFWPGPLTIVVKKNTKVADIITAGLDSVGLRMPKHELALDLINELGHPVAAPSANKFKKTSPTKPEHVKESFPEILTLDGGACEVGIESTVVGIRNGKVTIFRPGMITKSQIEQALHKSNSKAQVEYGESPVAPGQMEHHYMPKVPVILFNNEKVNLSKIPEDLRSNPKELILGDNPAVAARKLYGKLREYDQKYSCIMVYLSPKKGQTECWMGIKNRLVKAASFTF